jgi:WD40 repeat protein
LEYSIDNGATWKLITNEATGLQYLWKNIPKPGSDKCLVRVTQIIGNESYDKNAKLLLTLTGNSNYHNHLTWKPNGSQIAAKGSENKAFIWNSYNGSLVYQLAGSYEYCYNLSWNKQENLIATSDYENITNIWDADNGDKLYTLNGPCGWQEDLAWDYEGKQLAVVGSNTANNGVGCILIWDATTGLLVQNLNGHANPVNQVRWNPVGKYIATSSQDGSIIIWNANNGDIISTFELKDNVNFIDWNPDGIRLASAGLDGSSVIWDAFSGSKILTLEETLNSKDEIKWSPDGNYVATSDGCDPIKIWDGYTGNLLKKFKESVGTVLACYFNWNPDGTLIASRSYYTKAFVWDVLSGNMIFILDHQSIISDIQWSPEGNRIATIGVDSTIKIWEIDDLSLQSDESDSVFSIVAPQPQAKDIDMHQCLVGSSKDSLVTGYISNAGTYKFRVDSIYFTGPDASAFKLIGGLPKFELMPGISKTSEFCFTPNKAGLHNAVINIITQSDTLTQNIIGEGVLPQFKLITDVIDFGTNEIGSVKDSTVALIKNISQNTVQIKDVVLLGPDKKQFEILTPGGFTLEPNESKQMTIRFHALYAGRTSCLIAFELNSAASPAIAQLYGRGIGGSVSIDNDSGYAGDLRKIKMKLGGVKINSLLSMASDFKATVRFQGSILAPLDHNQIKSISNDSTIIEITGKLGNDDVLAQLYLVVGLGYVPGTSIDILDFKWLDERGQEIDYDTETQSGTFTLLGICHEGGTRLLNPNGKVQLMLARPNPAGDEVEIGYELVESGRTQLFIINMNGERVKTLFDKEISSFGVNSEKITTSELSSGSYLVVLQTPTEMKSIKLEVIK